MAFYQLPSRRFGRTGIQMPVLSIGGMRFQQSWTDVEEHDLKDACQLNLLNTLQKGMDLGFHHLETARHYGSSELQLGLAMKNELY